jgi:D-threonate/D-erythronate kinase
MSPPHTALVSDDLTGALDSAVPFARAGWRTVVATGLPALHRALAAGADVVAVSLNSREINVEEATARAQTAVAALSEVPVLFKKIDSRMKGHVRAEALELVTNRGLKRIIVCPAIPELGRHVVDGHVTGHGIAVPIPVAFSSHGQIVIECPDARTDADLDRIIAHADGALAVGARGLAAAMARRSGAAGTRPLPLVPPRLPITFVIGSRDPVTRMQVDRLRAAYSSAQWIGAADGVLAGAPALADIVIVQLVDGGGVRDGASVSVRFATDLAPCLSTGHRTLFLTGGETAAACLDAMGIGVVQVLGEVQPGLPVSLPLDFSDAPHIVTKSGGFGEPGCLADIVRVATNQSRAI